MRSQTGSCALTCSSVAASVGLTALQLTVLNTQLTANSQGVCKVSLGQTLCRGESGVSPGLRLSYPQKLHATPLLLLRRFTCHWNGD